MYEFMESLETNICSVRSGTVRNLESARISMNGQVIR